MAHYVVRKDGKYAQIFQEAGGRPCIKWVGVLGATVFTTVGLAHSGIAEAGGPSPSEYEVISEI